MTHTIALNNQLPGLRARGVKPRHEARLRQSAICKDLEAIRTVALANQPKTWRTVLCNEED